MKKEDLFQAIGECDEELLHKSENDRNSGSSCYFRFCMF